MTTYSKGEQIIKKPMFVILTLSFILLFSSFALAGDDLVQTVVNGCKKELTTYCKDVKPGEGRGLACLYAYSDKLSGQCEYPL